MSIISFRFLVFVIGLLIIYYIIPKKYRWTILLLGSIIFYYLSSNKLILFVILSTITIYLTGLILDKYNNKIKSIKSLNISEEDKKKLKSKYKTKKKIYLFIGITINIIYIILTKYSGFVIDNINSILNLININYSFKISKILFTS